MSNRILQISTIAAYIAEFIEYSDKISESDPSSLYPNMFSIMDMYESIIYKHLNLIPKYVKYRNIIYEIILNNDEIEFHSRNNISNDMLILRCG